MCNRGAIFALRKSNTKLTTNFTTQKHYKSAKATATMLSLFANVKTFEIVIHFIIVNRIFKMQNPIRGI